MRFMMSMKAGQSGPPTPELMAELGKFNAEMEKAGVIIATGGIAPGGSRLKAARGKLEEVDGPFAETKELIAGWVLVQVKSREEAVELARRFMKLHQDVLGDSWEGETEIRQILGPEDFQGPR